MESCRDHSKLRHSYSLSSGEGVGSGWPSVPEGGGSRSREQSSKSLFSGGCCRILTWQICVTFVNVPDIILTEFV